MMLRRIFCSAIFFAILSSLYGQKLGEVDWSIAGDADDEVVIMLMGDMNIQNRADPASGFKYLLPTLQKADIRFCNLEGPFAGTNQNPNEYDIPHKPAWTHSDPEMAQGLVAAGFDVVGVANNVTFPAAALLRSLKVLDREGIQHTGGGNNKTEATAPVIIEKKGNKIAFVQYACTVFPYDHAASETLPGIAEVKISTSYMPPRNLDKPGQPPVVLTQIDPESLEEMVNNIKRARENADVVIVSYHWGVSNMFEPHPYQREVAHAAIEAGADMIFGHGAHKLQSIETWNDKPIFYCAGNAVFDWWKIRSGLNGLLVRMVVKDKVVDQISFVPLQRDDENTPHLLSAEKGVGRKLFEKVNASTHLDRARLMLKNQEVEVYNRNRSEEVPTLSLAWEIEGFSQPEGAVYDKQRDLIYVSNINGDSPTSNFDGDGFVSRLHSDGSIDQLKWITGLNDPTGMTLQGDTLWINDINEVVKVDVKKGQVTHRYPVPNAVMLDDISVSSDGKVFTNDVGSQSVFWLQDGRFTIFWADVKRGGPHGIQAEDDRLLIATSRSHELLSVDRGNRKPTVLLDDIGLGDGIVGIGIEEYLISDKTGRIFYFSPLGYKYTILDVRDKQPVAGMEFIDSKNLLVVPTHKNNSIQSYHVTWPGQYGASKVK